MVTLNIMNPRYMNTYIDRYMFFDNSKESFLFLIQSKLKTLNINAIDILLLNSFFRRI